MIQSLRWEIDVATFDSGTGRDFSPRKERNMRASHMLAVVVAGYLTASAAAGFASGLQDDVNQAETILKRFQAIPEQSIPVLANYCA